MHLHMQRKNVLIKGGWSALEGGKERVPEAELEVLVQVLLLEDQVWPKFFSERGKHQLNIFSNKSVWSAYNVPDLCQALGESAKYGDYPSTRKTDLCQTLYEGENINITKGTVDWGCSIQGGSNPGLKRWRTSGS